MKVLDELESKAKAATPGDWVSPRLYGTDKFPDYITKFHPPFLARIGAHDSRFIAAANPQTVLALVEVAEEAINLANMTDTHTRRHFDAALAKLEGLVKP